MLYLLYYQATVGITPGPVTFIGLFTTEKAAKQEISNTPGSYEHHYHIEPLRLR